MITCPRCGKTFRGKSVGTHTGKCGVTFDELFWAKVDKNGPNGCWVWNGYCQKFGHGWTRFGLAHRYAWEQLRGVVPEGQFVLHKCDNPPCVNPDHLYVGGRQDNQNDMANRGRSVWGERSHYAKLTAKQVKLIRSLFVRTGEKKSNANELAEQFGIKHGQLLKIVNGQSWRQLK